MVYPSAMDFFGCSRCKLSDIKPNFSELARFYNLDRRQRLADYYNENFNAIRPREYTTRTHDSLKISNGKWMWWSKGIGGKTELPYRKQ